jgi:hypothetical protein
VFYNILGFLLVSAVALAVATALAAKSWAPTRLVILAVALRIFGSTVRYEILFRFYDGLGDAVRYYQEGLNLARKALGGIASSPLSAAFWSGQGGEWWGTSFLVRVSGLFLLLTGPTMRGEFVVFSLASFVGLYALATAFRNSGMGSGRSIGYAMLIWVWPSLWFWPSSVGKEALLVLAIGLATLGYVGADERIRWAPFVLGLGLAFCIRPHVAAVLAMAAMAAHWLGGWERVSLRRVLESVVAVVLVVVAFSGMRAQFGLADADLEGMVEFVQFRSGQTERGGSNIGGGTLGPAAIPLAPLNVWMRPFPWEAHNLTSAFAAAELVLFWFLVWKRRRSVLFALRHWRKHRLLRFGLPLLAVYTLMIGITFANLGIIARQRAPVFPFMIVLLIAAPQHVEAREQVASGLRPERSRRAA